MQKYFISLITIVFLIVAVTGYANPKMLAHALKEEKTTINLPTETALPFQPCELALANSSQKIPAQCYLLNNCRGHIIPNVQSMQECIEKNGNSWRDENGKCISDLE